MRDIIVEIPEGVNVEVSGNTVIVRGPRGEVKKTFKGLGLSISVNGNNIDVDALHKPLINTVKKHILNMIKGVTEGFKKHMVIRYAHFPMNIEVKGKKVIIKNFLGERHPREAKVVGDVKITVKGQDLFIEGVDIEAVGQTAANIRQATKIRNKDLRIFQDGIYYALDEG